MSQEERQYKSIDDVLEKAGPFMPFQIIILLSTVYLSAALFYNNLLSMFTGYDPSWKCQTNSTSEFCKQNYNESISTDDIRYRLRCTLNRSEWDYTTVTTHSYVTEFDLVCSKTYLAALVGASYYIGGVIGSFTSGTLADRVGRKPVILITSLITTFSSIASSFISCEWQLIILNIFRGAGQYASFFTSMLYVSEIAPPKFRHLYTNSLQFATSCSFLYITLLAYYIKYWRTLSTYAALPGIPAIFIVLILPESPRWLLVHGRDTQAKRILKKICKIDCDDVAIPDQSTYATKRECTVADLFRNLTVLKLTVSLTIIWFFAPIIYYVCAMESSNLGGDIYQTFALSNIPDLISNISSAFLCNRVGRKKLVLGSFLLSGICLGSLALIPKSLSFRYVINLVLILVVKYTVNLTFIVLFLWTLELFPTVFRSRGFFICAISDRVGVVTVPFIIRLLHKSYILPYVITCILSITGSLVGMSLPETANKPTRETYDDFFTPPSTITAYTNSIAEVDSDGREKNEVEI